MNTVRDVFNYALEQHISMTTDRGRLKIKSPDKSSLTEDFLKSAKKHKQEIIGIIMAREFGAMRYIKIACRGLSLKSSQFAAVCNKEDLQLIGQGVFSPESLRAYAESFNEGVKSRRIEILIRENADVKDEKISNMSSARAANSDEKTQNSSDRWSPEFAAKGYVWCHDCKYFNNVSCNHADNPFNTVSKCPQAPRKCQWYEGKL